ncbi:hypothetical protein ACHAWX_001073 [Stephanocyclus meneghinianus]
MKLSTAVFFVRSIVTVISLGHKYTNVYAEPGDCFVDNKALSDAVNSFILEGCENNSSCGTVLTWGPIKNWCTSQVTSMRELFRSKKAFNSDISGWDTSAVTDMSLMFQGAQVFNQDISGWDVSAVTAMEFTFDSAKLFNQDISGWDTSSVKTMMGMFANTGQFNQDVSGWNISQVTTIQAMFALASAFNQNLCPWKNNFPFNAANNIFVNSGCSYKATPTDPSSSFCAAIHCVMTTNSPSGSPSKSPSHMPTTSPSKKPSFFPSSQPSYETSSQPSLYSSKLPSFQPSSENMSKPSFTPSASSSLAPSVHLLHPIWWYPDWEGVNKGCVSDGNQPTYMTQNNKYLFITKVECCSKHYSWNLEGCLGSSSVTSEKKYYPDWLGDDTCKNDGAAPTYMVDNPTIWLHDTLSSCCSRYYGWKMRECMNVLSSGLFYPDWAGTNKGCLNDGND